MRGNKVIRIKIFATIAGIFLIGFVIVLYRVFALNEIMDRVYEISSLATEAGAEVSHLQQEINNIDSQSTTVVIIMTIVAFTASIVGAYFVSQSAVKRL